MHCAQIQLINGNLAITNNRSVDSEEKEKHINDCFF